MVLEDLFADVIARIFLRRSQPEAQLSKAWWSGGRRFEPWRVGRREESRDIARKHELARAMVGGAVKHQQDILPGKLSRRDVQEGLEARLSA
jgi:hypothetical protein